MGQIVTIDEMMEHLDVGLNDPSRISNVVLEDCITSAERYVENYTGRQFAADPAFDSDDPVRRSITMHGTRRRRVRIPDLRRVELVTLDDSILSRGYGYELDDYGGEPATALTLMETSPWTFPWTGGAMVLAVSGWWGWLPAPDDVRDAIRFLAARRYRKRDANFSDSMETQTASFAFQPGVPADVRDVLDLYRMPQVAIV